eukprot:5600222-Pyramimonas_sp.AAC.1
MKEGRHLGAAECERHRVSAAGKRAALARAGHCLGELAAARHAVPPSFSDMVYLGCVANGCAEMHVAYTCALA